MLALVFLVALRMTFNLPSPGVSVKPHWGPLPLKVSFSVGLAVAS